MGNIQPLEVVHRYRDVVENLNKLKDKGKND